MAGEINGTNILIQKGASPTEIFGQMEATLTMNGTPIDISNKSLGDFVTLMDGEISSQQIVITGTMVYNVSDNYEAIKAEAFTGTQDDYSITFTGGESYTGKFVPSGISDAIPHGDKVTTSVTFSSSGEVTRTPQTV
jgi:predicted secreted protein